MSISISPDDLAFPRVPAGGRGMELRTYLASQAMAAMITGIVAGAGDVAHNWKPEDFAREGVKHADALIAELNK